jgi:steroid delta-isomerase-like uncharacterized protein
MAVIESLHNQIKHLITAWNNHDLDALVALHAADYEGRDVGQPGVVRGLSEVRTYLERYLLAFPDIELSTEDVLIDGETAALLWQARGTHQGVLMHIPATGRTVVVRGVSMITFRGGKIWRGSTIWDVAGLLRAIGLLPEL